MGGEQISVEQHQHRRELVELFNSMRRQNEALDAWVDATPPGLQQDELRDAARRFATLAEEAGPRRGLCRFGRDTTHA